ncbi:MAG: hypothetical protein KatS3mg104_1274 [Phycisphaerae bacterium]|jgi:anti-anti-sigma factor|nr:MAG: hypothetical protein KatS3mg104_1274 [Phycisphaerae bacterium]
MIKTDEYNGVCVLSINGQLSADECKVCRQIVEKQIDEKQIVNFALDLAGCDFIDSQGLETMLWLRRKCEDLFGMLKVVGLNDTCRKILEITRLDHQFDIENDLSFALKSMR